MQPADLDHDYPLQISRSAVCLAAQLEGHLLTSGEQSILSRWNGLGDDDAHVLARLVWRKVQPVRLDTFFVPGVDDLTASLNRLLADGFIDGNSTLPRAMKLSRMTVAELKTLAHAHGLPSAGNRAELITRTQHLPPGDGAPDLVRPRHIGLFRRMFRAYMRSHDGDLSEVVLSQMGRRKPAVYTPTEGVGRFRNRKGLTEYERALKARMRHIDETEWDSVLTTASRELDLAEKPPAHRWRFSARRMWEELAARCLRHAERVEPAEAVYERYSEHLQKDLVQRGRVLHRAALTAGRSGRPIEGVALCQTEWAGDCTDFAQIRTGKRLAKQADTAWRGPSLPPAPPTFTVTTSLRPKRGRWQDGERSCSVEQVVMEILAADGLEAFHVESAAWTTLFGLLYSEALFASIPGMLPTPHLRGPIDLGTPSFLERRCHIIEDIEADIHGGNASRRLTASWERSFGQDIIGVRWTAMPLDALCWLADSLPSDTLVGLMEAFATNWWHAARGWPDLVVLDRTGLKPRSDSVKLIEVKGPTDTLRDAQRWWLNELLRLKIDARVWSVVPQAG